ncbi:MAG: hypothetical protein ACYC0J_10340 [Gammaproteobacteria bacterium]
MSSEQIIEQTKKRWPLVLGAIIGLYVISKYYGASAATGASVTSQQMTPAAYYAAQNQAAQTQIAANTAAAQTANQTMAISDAGQAAYLQSQALVANAVINGAVNLVTAQSMIPIAAINSATIQNQQTIKSAADVAIANSIAAGQVVAGEAQVASSTAMAAGNAAQSSAAMAAQVIQSNNAAATASGNQTASYVETAATVAMMLL